MKALVYHGPEHRYWEDVAEPRLLDPDDVVLQVDAVTICGTDLHILKGDVPTVEAPRVLGHEAVGTVEEVGPGVRTLRAGDRVLASCISSCGRCRYCREGRFGQCLGGGGWILGHRIDGVQAEKVRIPFADTSTHRLPDEVSDEAALLLADILPTSYEVGVLLSHLQPGDTVVIVGAGPIGLAAVRTAQLFTPRTIIVVDPADARRDAAKAMGADLALRPDEDVKGTVLQATDGLGADVAIEAVGIPETFEACTELVRPGGHVANVGVHGAAATLHLESLWIRDITVTTGLVDTTTTPTLLALMAAGRLPTYGFITHRFGLDEMQDAYDIFARPSDSGALKVALFRSEPLG
jgi:alcohol dehydrogenase